MVLAGENTPSSKRTLLTLQMDGEVMYKHGKYLISPCGPSKKPWVRNEAVRLGRRHVFMMHKYSAHRRTIFDRSLISSPESALTRTVNPPEA